MQTVSSDRSTCWRLASGTDATPTVLMPSSRHARKILSAISPRLAIKTLSSIANLGVYDEEQLAVLDGTAVLGEDAHDSTADVGVDLIHHLHRFDDAERVSGIDDCADLDERLCSGARTGIERTDHRCSDLVSGRRGFARA